MKPAPKGAGGPSTGGYFLPFWPTLAVSGVLVAVLSIAGCASTPPIPVPEIIHDPTYIPVPVTLTAPISVDLTNATWGSGIATLKAALETCNGNLKAIDGLKPPNPPR